MAITKEEVVEWLSAQTVLEVADLVKELEEKWGVSAAAPVAVAAAGGAAAGGAGAAVSEFLVQQGIVMPVLHIGLPDRFIDHGNHSEQLRDSGLDKDGILHNIEQRLNILNLPKRAS